MELSEETLDALEAAIEAAKSGQEDTKMVSETTENGEGEVRFTTFAGGLVVEIEAGTMDPLTVAVKEAIEALGGRMVGGSKGGLFSSDFTFTV